MKPKITLTADEGMAAVNVAALQMMRKITKGWDKDHGSYSNRNADELWTHAISGCMAESAACKFLGTYWATGPNGQESDAGGVEVRASINHNAHLIIYPKDINQHPGSPFLLITGHWPTFLIHGWITCKEAKHDKWWRKDANPASYWVPQSALNPPEGLRE